jgi:hypothetical protein
MNYPHFVEPAIGGAKDRTVSICPLVVGVQAFATLFHCERRDNVIYSSYRHALNVFK